MAVAGTVDLVVKEAAKAVADAVVATAAQDWVVAVVAATGEGVPAADLAEVAVVVVRAAAVRVAAGCC